MRTVGILLVIALSIGALIGEIKCIVKAYECNWEPVGKAEIIYTASVVTGLGCIVGYIDIQDK